MFRSAASASILRGYNVTNANCVQVRTNTVALIGVRAANPANPLVAIQNFVADWRGSAC